MASWSWRKAELRFKVDSNRRWNRRLCRSLDKGRSTPISQCASCPICRKLERSGGPGLSNRPVMKKMPYIYFVYSFIFYTSAECLLSFLLVSASWYGMVLAFQHSLSGGLKRFPITLSWHILEKNRAVRVDTSQIHVRPIIWSLQQHSNLPQNIKMYNSNYILYLCTRNRKREILVCTSTTAFTHTHTHTHIYIYIYILQSQLFQAFNNKCYS